MMMGVRLNSRFARYPSPKLKEETKKMTAANRIVVFFTGRFYHAGR